ncbi:MAG: 2-oxoglutarate dehydrogenase complex dihydrolipoyllysine-residue succinyltransferase [Acidobacteriota bacterium]|nr:2-oxoglutarate dehydrogenase complex dihydrolipoyllysine-residue succinyltransferase [Acidobacteriota bacterium]
MTYEVRIPEIGESVTEALIIRWIKQPGEAIGRDDPLVELETDKVTVEMPSPVAGVLSEIVCAEGETVPIGAVIARIEEGAQGDLLAGAQPSAERVATPTAAPVPALAAEPPPPAPAQLAEAQPAAAEPQGEERTAAEERRILPAARRLIAEHGLDASLIPATGKGGRLLKSDVAAWLATREAEAGPPAGEEREAASPAPAPPPPQAPAPAPTGAPPAGDRAEERVPMTPIRRRIAERLVESQQQAALLTTFNEIDMSAVMDFRRRYRDSFVERHDVRLGFLSFFVKAAVDALRRFPRLNAEISGTDIIYRNYYDIGIAVSTDRGLMVPVLRSAERLSFAEIESRIGDFAGRAREGRIRIDELQGGTFTITNGGIFGSLLSTPIINPPQSGVLGLHAIQNRPMVVDGEVVVRPMMYVALTYDHRIVDGREAVSFLVRIKEAIQEPARMLIEV